MEKKLSEMSLKELWKLFPIELSISRNEWKTYYQELENDLISWLSPYSDMRISHIGSTAIRDIKAKNIIDVLIEFPAGTDLLSRAKVLEKHDCIIMNVSENRVSL